MSGVAVVAHSGKSLGGGLPSLRRALDRAGVTEPLWYEVDKSKRAPECVEHALAHGADRLIVWGGDGMVQRVVDAMIAVPRSDRAPLAIVPAGTANVLADNLGIPHDVDAAVDSALHGDVRPLDVGVMNGEAFAVMAGAGLDSLMIRDADGALKRRLGRASYVVAAVRHIRLARFGVRVEVDGQPWFRGRAGCVLVGNVGRLLGGLAVFPDALPDDGQLDVGVVTAQGMTQWARATARALAGSPTRSPFVRETRGRKVRVDLDTKLPYEVDGGARGRTRRLKARVRPHAVDVCVPSS
ncbi:MAG TPA: YegS/Rv2252/BmrU family lipid kinase [Acidimicrobiia bacterium]